MIIALLVEIVFVVSVAVLTLWLITMGMGRKSQGTKWENEVAETDVEVMENGAAAKIPKKTRCKSRQRWNMSEWCRRRFQNRVEQDADGWKSKVITVLKLAHPVSPFIITAFSGVLAIVVFESCIVSDVMIVRDDFIAEKERCIGSYGYCQAGRTRRIAVAWGKDQVINASSHPVVIYEILYGKDDGRKLHSFVIGSGEAKQVRQSDFHRSPKIPKQVQFSNDAETYTTGRSCKVYQAWWYANVRPTPEEYYEAEAPRFDDRYGWTTLELTRQAWKPDFREADERNAAERNEE